MENFTEKGWPWSPQAHPLNPPIAVFRKSDEMVPIVPSQNSGSLMEEDRFDQGLERCNPGIF